MIDLKIISVNDFDGIFKTVGEDWMLIAACDNNCDGLKYNAMTASWGGMGVMWNKNVFWCFIRPQRYTKEFVDNSDKITLSFFDSKYKDALTLCGRKSGRDGDKISEAGLTVNIVNDEVYFNEAEYTVVGRKLYVDEIKKDGFIDKTIVDKCYPDEDFHFVYVCEIEKIVESD